MTPAAFRKTALSFPETAEASHMGHPDFRVRGKIFATLGPDEDWGMVKLTPEQQAPLVQDRPAIFQPASGAWGRRGCTIIQLKRADKLLVRQALLLAWRNTAPKKLVQEQDGPAEGERLA
ncbi:MAG: MmcQ/YjbR family DNA-binding protein [Pirellulaceae bacterium]